MCGLLAARHVQGANYCQQEVFGCGLLSARGVLVVKGRKRGVGAGNCQQEVFGVRAIVSKRCLGGKRQQERKVARRDEAQVIGIKRSSGVGYCQQEVFGW